MNNNSNYMAKFIILIISFLIFFKGTCYASTGLPTVSSASPANNATNISTNALITVKYNKEVDPSTVNSNTFIVTDLQTSAKIPGAITSKGDNLTFYFLPSQVYSPNQKYTLSLKGVQSMSGIEGGGTTDYTSSFTTTERPFFNIFVTNGTYKGSFFNYDQSGYDDSIAAADYLCNTNSMNPDKANTYYKAMVAADPNYDYRHACKGQSCGSANSYDWVLQANTSYYNSNHEKIATTTANAIFTFPLKNPLSKNYTSQVWTGLNSAFSQDDSCVNWSRGVNDYHGRSGKGNAVDSKSISDVDQDCDLGFALYCVAQPSVVMLKPNNGESIATTNISITVMFNTVNSIDKNTVNSTNFIVTVEGTKILGKISESGNKYIFKPDQNLANNKTYIVKISNIKDVKGLPVRDAEFSFTTTPQAKLLFATDKAWWGNLGGVSGADEMCQADSKCKGKTCKAVISDYNKRRACSEKGQCGSAYAKDWVLLPNTYYMTSSGLIIGKTNESAIFPFTTGYKLQNPIGSGRVWTGMGGNWTPATDKKALCDYWVNGNGGDKDELGGALGEAGAVDYMSIGTGTAGSCSEYTYKDPILGTGSCETNGKLEGCSKRKLYCAEIQMTH